MLEELYKFTRGTITKLYYIRLTLLSIHEQLLYKLFNDTVQLVYRYASIVPEAILFD